METTYRADVPGEGPKGCVQPINGEDGACACGDVAEVHEFDDGKYLGWSWCREHAPHEMLVEADIIEPEDGEGDA